jgi:hypothetical protein
LAFVNVHGSWLMWSSNCRTGTSLASTVSVMGSRRENCVGGLVMPGGICQIFGHHGRRHVLRVEGE